MLWSEIAENLGKDTTGKSMSQKVSCGYGKVR